MVQMSPPRSPPLVQVCGGLLYCTTTFTVFEGFESSGNRSGEILEVSANADPAASKTSQRMANRESCLLYLVKKDCIGPNRKQPYGQRTPRDNPM